MRRAAKLAVWIVGIPCVLLLLLYLVLLATPIRLPFAGQAVRGFVQSLMPAGTSIDMGDMALALENGIWPVVRFAPVTMVDRLSGAHIDMEAFEVGFSPARALFGQPGATVTVVGPHLQLVQDLHGPRLARFELVEDPEGGTPTLRVLEGQEAFATVDISESGVGGNASQALRSDNDWLIYNLEATNEALAELIGQVAQGRFSRLVVRDGTLDMSDSVYGLYRRFEDLTLEMGASADAASGEFSASIGGRKVVGTLERTGDAAGGSRLQVDATNMDFSALLPFLDDRDSMAGIQGAGALSMDIGFDPAGTITGGAFKIDMTGSDLRVRDDYFPIASSILDVAWEPASGQFRLAEGTLRIGDSSAIVSGLFALGLDAIYGPTVGISLAARDVYLQPYDLPATSAPFTEVTFSGWSAPLYGAVGIDRLVARKDGVVVETAGRFDMLRAGIGIRLDVAGAGASADDVKRLWPYFMGKESRDWFVANVTDGRVKDADLHFNFPVGTLALEGEDKPIPEDGMRIDMVGEGVAIKPTESMAPIVITGDTRLVIDDANIAIAGGGGVLDTDKGRIAVRNPALLMDNSDIANRIVEISGDLSAPIPAMLELVRQQQPQALEGLALPVDLGAITGSVDLGLLTTIVLEDQKTGRPLQVDYVVNGTVADFASSEPIQGRRIGNGQLSVTATQEGYELGGTAEIDGMATRVALQGKPDGEPVFRLGSTVAVADLAKMGFDASAFLSGTVDFQAQPLADGELRIVVDLAQAGLTIRDLGITKSVGTPGTLSASVRMDGETTHLQDITLAFGGVHLAGALDYHATRGLVAADFDTFALSAGDSATLALSPIEGGYAVRIRGRQLDLKPMLGRFFSLEQGSGGVQSTQFSQSIALDVELDRAIGYYATTAFNLDLDLLLRGTDLRRATLTAQFSEGNAVSITTNPAPRGRTLTVAFNDAGTVLRLLGVYSQLAGGSGSLVLTTDRDVDAEGGRLVMHGFALVDEDKVVQVLGNHTDSRAAISQKNRLDFSAGQVDFIRRSDRVEVTNAVLTGDTVGGTLRGVIYTDRRQYDLAGTYVPLFGLNSAFQKIPLLGPLLGGREGEGLVGVTFAVRGPLDNPEFRINPLSLLAPGVFRELFEFRTRELPAGR